MELAPGSRLGPFEIVSLRGRGGMGEVYRARDTRLGREVAIKVLPPAVSADPDRRRRFRLEAQAVSALSHPHVCTLYDIGSEGETDYLVMEYLPGESLAERLGQGPLPIPEAARLAGQIADALAAAHAKGIVHRDLKPDNVRITSDGSAKVLDFGLAKVLEPEAAGARDLDRSPTVLAPLTGAHVVLGTAGYMSPEQARGDAVDARADVWAFGVVLFEMLAGRPPFTGSTAVDVVAAVLRARIPFTRLPADLPSNLRALVVHCLERDPERRPVDGAALQQLLGRAASPSGASAGDASSRGEANERSIVVLPFANLSPDPDNEYFSDGLTEEVIADLSKVEALRVISRTSAMRYKGTRKDLRTIGRELEVRYALEGGVRKADTDLRITAQLIDTRTDTHLWSEKYGGTLDDVFEIQERVSRAIVDALRVHLSPTEERRLQERPFQDGFVYDLYLRARRDVQSMSRERVQRARADLERALEITGENVLIYRGLAMAAWQMLNAGFSADPGFLDEAEEYGRKILALDPDGPHGHVIMGYVAGQRGNRLDWVRHFRRAVALDPGDPEPHIWLAGAWTFAGRPDDAAAMLDRLEAIDPLVDWLHLCRAANAYFAGRFEETKEHAERAMELGTGHPGGPAFWAQAALSLGDLAGTEALLRDRAPDPSAHPILNLAHVVVAGYRRDRGAIDRLAGEEFRERMWEDLQYSHFMAQAYALAGDRAEGLRWLTRAADLGLMAHTFLAGLDPLLENLRPDPRFTSLMDRIRAAREAFLEGMESD